jgi:hypothetical protein
MGRAYLRGFIPFHSPHRLKQAPDICFLGDQGKQGPTVAERVGGANTPAANDDASRRGTPLLPIPRKESHDGQAAVPVGSAIRAG